MNAWQRFWHRRSRKARRRVRRRIAAVRFRRLVSEQLEPRVVLAAPVAIGDSYSVIDNCNPLAILPATGVLANDNDADNDPLIAVRVDGPVHGTLNLNAGGIFQYTPSVNFEGFDSFTYRASDGTASSGIATVTLNIYSLGDTPVTAVSDVVTATEDMPRTVAAPGVLANDSSSCGQPLTAQLVSPPPYGSLAMGSDGSFTYVPSLNFNGAVSFTYRATDGGNVSNVGTVVLNLQPVPDPPVANYDIHAATEDIPRTVALPGLLSNDVDVDGDSLVTVLSAAPAHGNLALGSDGRFTYTPSLNFNGADSFTYRANDGSLDSNLATVTITILSVNDNPTAVGDGPYTATEDTPLTVTALPQNLLFNDFDVDNDPNLNHPLVPDMLALQLVGQPSNANGPQGTVTLDYSGAFTYTPAFNNNTLTVTFTYRVFDFRGGTSGLATVPINIQPVNDAPVAIGESYVTPYGNNLFCDSTIKIDAANGVLRNDYDPDGDPLSAVLISAPIHGVLSMASNGAFTYSPHQSYFGLESFIYRASDGQALSNYATVVIEVPALGDPPIGSNDRYLATEDTLRSVAAPGVLINDFDPDTFPGAAALLGQGPQHGSLTLSPNGGFTYAPSPNFHGTDTFLYRWTDGTYVPCDYAVVTITVQSVNDAPVAVGDSFGLSEDTPGVIAAPGILSHDSDADGDTLAALVVQAPVRGVFQYSPSGGFTYTPSLNFFGADSFTYRALDGITMSNLATVTLNVQPVNDAPVAFGDRYSATTNGTLTVAPRGALLNDIDVDVDSLTIELGNGPQFGVLSLAPTGGFTYVPSVGLVGLDSFTYRAFDGALYSNTATVSIQVFIYQSCFQDGNDSYVVTEDVARTVTGGGVLENDCIDPDLGPVSTVLDSIPGHGTLSFSSNGQFTYSPLHDFNGKDGFTYRISDGQNTSYPFTVTLNVLAVNDPPVAVGDSFTATEDAPLKVSAGVGVLANDFDVDNTTPPLFAGLSATLVPGGAPKHPGTFAFGSNGSFTYTPAQDFNGADSFTYRAIDPAGFTSGVATVTINIQPVNDSPVAWNDMFSPYGGCGLISTGTIGPPGGVLGNDSDADGDPLVAVLVSQLQSGTVTLNADGSFSYSNLGSFIDRFTYKASDGKSDSNIATVTLNFARGAPTPPDAVGDSYTLTEDAPPAGFSTSVLVNDTDCDGDTLFAHLENLTSHGALTFSLAGTFTYAPAKDFSGVDSFTYRAFDGIVESQNVATATLNVLPINDPPVANGDGAFGATSGIPLLLNAPGVLLNDYDVDNFPILWQGLIAVLGTGPNHGALTLAPNGAFTYFPSNDPCVESDSFTYRASDGQASSGLATVTIYAAGLGDAPVAVNDYYTVSSGASRAVSAPGILSNDLATGFCSPIHSQVVSVPTGGLFAYSFDGAFTYTPVPGFQGVASFTYRAVDEFGLTTNLATVTLNVLPINDPPTFTKGPDQHVADDSEPRLVAGWAKDISPGPPDEAGQTAAFSIVGNTNPGIFDGSIAIDPAGKLSFTSKPNTEGTAVVTVRLQDSGGTANGGIDFSEQQFQIIVDKPHRWHNGMPPLSPHDRGGLEVVFEDEARSITPTDVLLVINYLNSGLPTAIDTTMPLANGTTRPFYDVDGDDVVTPTDALLIIDVLNAGHGGPVGGEGEAASSAAANAPPKLAELITMMALDAAELETRRRTGR